MQLTNNRAYTLPELLISLSLGLIISAAALQLLIAISQTDLSRSQSSHLDHELNALLSQMVREIRRTAYIGENGLMPLFDSRQWNPFISNDQDNALMLAFADIDNSDHDPGTYDCMVFAYDSNGNGIDDGSNERFGYRFSENAVKIRSGSISCAQSGWIKISDDQSIRITRLSFRPVAQAIDPDRHLLRCRITILLQGELSNDASIQLQLSQTLTIANLIADPSGKAAVCR